MTKADVLITGASGYLGGTLLARWQSAQISGYEKLYALIRKPEQAETVKKLYDAEPVQASLEDEDAVQELVVSKRINPVFFLIDAYSLQSQTSFIKGLSALKAQTGLDTHFIYTLGTQQFSRLLGLPNNRPLDTDPELYELQKNAKTPMKEMKVSLDTNCRVVELGLEFRVNTYAFSPCIVYSKEKDFGNPILIQTVNIVNAALAYKHVYIITNPSDPVYSISNTINYAILIKAVLNGQDLNYSKNSFYLASSSRVCWMDLYKAVAKALYNRGLINDDYVRPITKEARETIGKGLGITPDTIKLKVAGNSWYKPDHAKANGWKPEFGPSIS
ncbi:nad dependent epimerase dehydratase family [Fusarium subglutinans]|uniref:Nad dependent epimerase dehydratase family n=1 Tax=Gibberella subglutinans TaxID=42677 RepID=A0A8H5LCG6_GIBSU|nr:nad dependent epimerase dehydratase family [Fusarium subglutinans]KAF5589024.1 nad dependent epimerase dehydratase family [Fusarium subglutinans]